MPATPRALQDFLYPGPENPDLGAKLVAEALHKDRSPSKMLTTLQLEDMPDPTWYLDKFIQEDALTLVYGPPKTGKTFLCVDWATRMALGMDWLGHRSLPVRVLYASAEGNKALGQRTRALRAHYGLPVPENLMWLPGVTQLYFKGERPDAQMDLMLAINEFQPHVVFFDTLARHTPGGDVASNQDMSRVVQVADEIRSGFGASVVFVHHTRKDGSDYLGATALYGAADAMIHLSPSNTRGKFELGVIAKELEDYTPPWIFELFPSHGSAVVVEGDRYMSGSKKDMVLAFLAQAGSATANEIQMALWEQAGRDAATYLKEMEKDGGVMRVGDRPAQGAGRPSVLWALAGPKDEEGF